MNNLAATYSALGRFSEAVELQEKVMAFWRKVLPEDHVDLGAAMGNLAFAYGTMGK
jgi:hypothetical protein